jgi:hypothetical protein
MAPPCRPDENWELGKRTGLGLLSTLPVTSALTELPLSPSYASQSQT